jgi:carboxyl-terminal processing protease
MARPSPVPAPSRVGLRRLGTALALLLLGVAWAGGGYAARFDTAWSLVDERYWDVGGLSVDWDAMRERYRPEALAAPDDAAFFAVLEAMYARIGDDHSVFVPPEKVERIRREYGDLPCLGVFGLAQTSGAIGHVDYRMLDDAVGYVRLPDLASDGVANATRRSVVRLQSAGARAFVLDLRGNPGGRLVSMMQVAGIFTRGFLWRTVTHWALPIPYPALGSVVTDRPLVVLVDAGVNSAAEGLAGALQQRGRAVVVGQRTAGNVEAVLPFCLRDGSQAWIATGVLAPIGGPTWEGRGVVPDLPTKPEGALDEALRWLSRSVRPAAP